MSTRGTSQTYNVGTIHYGPKPGTKPFCGNRRAHFVRGIADWNGDEGHVCKRCLPRLLKYAAKKLAPCAE